MSVGRAMPNESEGENENIPKSRNPFRLSLGRFLILAAIAPLAIYYGVRYWMQSVADQTIVFVEGRVILVDFDLNELGRREGNREALARLQIEFRGVDGDRIGTTIDGVSISPAFLFVDGPKFKVIGGAEFKSQATCWNYEEKIVLVRKQMDNFVKRNPDFKVDYATLVVEEQDRVEQGGVLWGKTILKQQFDTYPPAADDDK
ncbi:MAG: hypothetical protein COA78_08375 [Blastopirellula sp.]|nr:MAG: hypothetical protein COA78_08375 [Blastopirellula sp.]